MKYIKVIDMKTIKILMLLMLGIVAGAYAQSSDRSETNSPVKFGAELDVLPYATGGYYGSVWVGKGHIRVRPVISQVSIPSFYVKKGFTDNKLTAYAFLADYFLKDNFEGLWVGTGLEYWDSSIKRKADLIKKNYNNTQFTLGTGYILKVYRGIYVNPWAAFHLRIGGDKTVSFPMAGDVTLPSDYKTKFFTPEASLKVGIKF